MDSNAKNGLGLMILVSFVLYATEHYIIATILLIFSLLPFYNEQNEKSEEKRRKEEEEQRKLDNENEKKENRINEEIKMKKGTGGRNLRSYLSELRTNTRLIEKSKENTRKNNILIMSIDTAIDNIVSDELITEEVLNSDTVHDELADIIKSLSEKGFSTDPVTNRIRKLFDLEKKTVDKSSSQRKDINIQNVTKNIENNLNFSESPPINGSKFLNNKEKIETNSRAIKNSIKPSEADKLFDGLQQKIRMLRDDGVSYFLIADDFNEKNIPMQERYAKFEAWSPKLVKLIERGEK